MFLLVWIVLVIVMFVVWFVYGRRADPTVIAAKLKKKQEADSVGLLDENARRGMNTLTHRYRRKQRESTEVHI